jgi:hypothetical protein
MTNRTDPHEERITRTIHVGNTTFEAEASERNNMSTLAQRARAIPRWGDLPLRHASKTYFLLGQNTRGMWVIRENTGHKAGVFLSREAALRFARLESADEHIAVVDVNDGLEFDYAAQHL